MNFIYIDPGGDPTTSSFELQPGSTFWFSFRNPFLLEENVSTIKRFATIGFYAALNKELSEPWYGWEYDINRPYVFELTLSHLRKCVTLTPDARSARISCPRASVSSTRPNVRNSTMCLQLGGGGWEGGEIPTGQRQVRAGSRSGSMMSDTWAGESPSSGERTWGRQNGWSIHGRWRLSDRLLGVSIKFETDERKD